jgi:pyruvate ferredoxin oxidoreductase gamma subunit
MIEIRFHGRGGQGAVTSVELLALAAIGEGKFAQGFPSFGPERRGAPVMAFCRVDDKHIRLRCKILQPDVVVVLDASLLRIQNPPADLRENGIIILNTPKTVAENKIAREVLGVPIVNTTMIGALLRVPGVVQVESLEAPLKERFGPLAVKNFNAMKVAYEATIIEERQP